LSTTPGRVLGGEACSWSELVTDELLEVRIWGRLPALAERFWSPRSTTDVQDMYRRLELQVPLLAAFAAVDLPARQTELFATIGIDAMELEQLQHLLDALEPVKWYARLLGAAALRARVAGSSTRAERPYTVTTPLNRVVDFIAPASLWAITFDAAVRTVMSAPDDADARAMLTDAAARWRRQRPVVETLAGRSAAIAELQTLARRLCGLADVVEACLAGKVTDAHRRAVAAALEPEAELLIAVAPSLARWLDCV